MRIRHESVGGSTPDKSWLKIDDCGFRCVGKENNVSSVCHSTRAGQGYEETHGLEMRLTREKALMTAAVASVFFAWGGFAGAAPMTLRSSVDEAVGAWVAVVPLIVAGDPSGMPPDPLHGTGRIDDNVPSSAYAGVGSLNVAGGRCTGSLISPIHVLSAGHCFDNDSNGIPDVLPGQVQFILNDDGDSSFMSGISAVNLHPDFTGFANPSLRDDVSVVTLNDPAPAGVPIYDLWRTAVPTGAPAILVGYGNTGNGTLGQTVLGNYTTKRVGANALDFFVDDDEGSGTLEAYQFDFDFPDGSNGDLGGPSLGNDVETSIRGGDSGGPAFLEQNGELLIAGVNTFLLGSPLDRGRFGTVNGGMLVPAYADFIDGIVGPSVPEPGLSFITLTALTVLTRRRAGRG
jgi:hypothetical protein